MGIIQTSLPPDTLVHVELGLILTIASAILSFLISGEIEERKWISTKNRLFVTAIAMLITGLIFTSTSAPGPLPVASDSLGFSEDGIGTFIVRDSPYLTDYVRLEGAGGLHGSVDAIIITISFYQQGIFILSTELPVPITSASNPYHGGQTEVILAPGEYRVEVVVPDGLWITIHQLETDGRSIAQRAWDSLKLDYLLLQGILFEFTLIVAFAIRRALETKESTRITLVSEDV